MTGVYLRPPHRRCGPLRIPEQVQRLAILIGAVVAGVLVTRFVLIPRHLIASDLHQSSTVQREMAKPMKFAGSSPTFAD